MAIETRGIEFIPESERHGRARSLFFVWFSSQMQVTTLVVGALGIASGLSLFWSVAGILVGNVIGTIFMAAHSTQGPHLGIPQMIQSRAQFGVTGANVPLIVVVNIFILFTAANAVVMRKSIEVLLPVSDNAAIILFGLGTLVITFIGYDLIHRFAAYMTYLSGALFILACFLLLRHPVHKFSWGMSRATGFTTPAFLLMITQACSWTLGFSPVVADYSRYLPASIPSRSIFWNTYLGTVLGASFIMVTGALLAAGFTFNPDNPGEAVAGLFGPYSIIVYVVIVLGVLENNVFTLYSAFMSSSTIFAGVRGISTITLRAKFVIMAAVMVIVSLIAITTQYDFNRYFTDVLVAQIYFVVPWSSINLVDFYLVRHAKYSIPCIYKGTGTYGTVNRATLLIYGASIVIQLPFMDLSFYQGAIYRRLGADVAWIPGLIVPGILYMLSERRRIRAGLTA